MSANMTAIVLPMPGTPVYGVNADQTVPGRDDVSAAATAFMAVYTAVSDEDKDQWAAEAELWLDLNLDPDLDLHDFPAVENAVTEVITEAVDCLGGNDWTEYHFDGRVFMITGGLSYGDDPTDSFSAWNRLLNMDLNGVIWTALKFGS